MLKGLPLAYNRDLQEDKEPVFDAVDTLELLLPAFAGMIATMSVRRRPARRRGAGRASRSPPRSRSGWSGEGCRSARRTRSPASCVAECESAGVELWDLTDADLAAVSRAADARGPLGADGRGLAGVAATPTAARRRIGSPSSWPSCAAAPPRSGTRLARAVRRLGAAHAVRRSLLTGPSSGRARGCSAWSCAAPRARAPWRSGSPRSRRTTAPPTRARTRTAARRRATR